MQLQLRISERDQVVGQYDQFRQSIREALGRPVGVLKFPDGEPVERDVVTASVGLRRAAAGVNPPWFKMNPRRAFARPPESLLPSPSK